MTTYAQSIRDALRALGGSATAQDIADRCTTDTDAGAVSKQLWSGEQQGWVQIDRTERPFRYLLLEERAAKVEACVATNPSPHSTPDKPMQTRKKRAAPDHRSRRRLAAEPGPAKRELTARQIRATPSATGPAPTLDHEWSQRLAAQAAPVPNNGPVIEVGFLDGTRTETIPLHRGLILRLCALALSPDERTPADLRDITAALKAAA